MTTTTTTVMGVRPSMCLTQTRPGIAGQNLGGESKGCRLKCPTREWASLVRRSILHARAEAKSTAGVRSSLSHATPKAPGSAW